MVQIHQYSEFASIAQRLVRQSSKLGMRVRFPLFAQLLFADMAKLAAALDLESSVEICVWVRVPLSALIKINYYEF